MYCINKNIAEREFCLFHSPCPLATHQFVGLKSYECCHVAAFKRLISFQKLKIQLHHCKVIFFSRMQINKFLLFNWIKWLQIELKRLIPDYLFIALFLSFICICERSRNTMNQPSIYVKSHNIWLRLRSNVCVCRPGNKGKICSYQNSLEAVHST